MVEKIHLFDGRRLDRCLSYFGLEARVPFLDIDFIKTAWDIPASYRMPSYKNIEKYLLRKAFEGFLDNECLDRPKEAFSDGITKKNRSIYSILDEKLKDFPIIDGCPTRESSFYKHLFKQNFNDKCYHILPHYWQPKFQNKVFIDPSARVLSVYRN